MLFTFTVDQILWPLTHDILMPFSIKFLVDTCPISEATDTPFFWTSGGVSFCFQRKSGESYSHLVEMYMYVP